MKVPLMQGWKTKVFILCLAIAGVVIFHKSGFSQTKEDVKAFYKGATVKFVVPYSPGGSYDLLARMLVPPMEKYTGAKFIVENMAGAAGLMGGAYLYSLAKPDGLTIGIFPMPGMILAEMMELDAVRYEIAKFSYIGRIEVGWRCIYVSKPSGFKSTVDMQKSTKPIRFGTVDPTSQATVDEALFAEALGLNAKIVPGYKGSKEMMMALIPGREEDAVATAFAGGYIDYVRNGEVTLIAIMGNKRHPDFPDAPCFAEIPNVKPEGRKYLDLLNMLNDAGRTILSPPGVPEEKRLFLEQALTEGLKDPAFVKWAETNDYIISPLPGKEYKSLIDNLTAIVPKANRPKIKHIVTEKYF